MSHGLPFGLKDLKRKVQEPSQVIQCIIMYEPLAVGLVSEAWIGIARYFDKSDDLIIAQPDHWVIDAALVQPGGCRQGKR